MRRKEQVYSLVKNSPLFDPGYYLSTYKNILPENCDLVAHFVQRGWKEGLNPSREFDTQQYLQNYPDVKKAGINPLVHYLKFGVREQRKTFEVEPIKNNLGYDNQTKNSVEQFVLPQNGDGLKIDNLLPLIKSLRNADFTSVQVKSLIADYYELYFQFTSFKQRPVIRIANYLDRHILRNSIVQKFLVNTLQFRSNLKNQGLKEYLKAKKKKMGTIAFIPKRHFREALPILPDVTVTLSQKILNSCIRYFADHPPMIVDILFFSSNVWNYCPESVQQLIYKFASLGHRVYYIEPASTKPSEIMITLKAKNIYVISLPWITQTTSTVSKLSNEEVSVQEVAVNELKHALNISSALIMTDTSFWQKLLLRLQANLNWKLTYYRADAHSGKFQENDDQKLIAKSDVVFDSLDNILSIEKDCTKLFAKISIVIVTYNNVELTKLCLNSIQRNTNYPNYEIIIVDNASSDATVEYLEQYKETHSNVILIKNEKNLGFAGGNNQGVKAASGEYIVFLNNDTIVTPGWLHILLSHLQKKSDYGMVGPVTNAIGNEAMIEVEYSNLDDINYFAVQRTAKMANREFQINVLALYCSMISRNLFIQLGGLDEQYRVGMFEDDDFAMKLRQVGLKLICAEDVFIHHFHGASFNKIDDYDLQRIFQENKLKYETKWGVVWKPHEHRHISD